jgi:hypothetical protein
MAASQRYKVVDLIRASQRPNLEKFDQKNKWCDHISFLELTKQPTTNWMS